MPAAMFDILILAILNSLLCTGVYIATQFGASDMFDDHPDAFRKVPIKDKMILWWVRYYGSYLPEFFRKPLYLCLPCMASIYSIPVWSVFSYYTGLNPTEAVALWLLYCPAVVGLNSIIRYNLI